MTEIYAIEQAQKWDDIVRSFDNYDVYYLSGYVKAFMLHGDGEPLLLYYEGEGLRAIYVFMRRETSLPSVYDSITPYGYGGVLFDRTPSVATLAAFRAEYVETMRRLGIADNFVRYHPVLCNAETLRSCSEVADLGKTIAIDLESEEVIWNNITAKNRNMIRKAERNGITIHHSKDLALLADFERIYNSTMRKDNAADYYYFPSEFYRSIHNDLHDNYEIFYALCGDVKVSMSIILFANRQMHYHLSGSLAEYRQMAPSNLLLYKAALWGCGQGFRTFHLGGGLGAVADSLYRFKAAFNRQSDYTFSIGREIFDEQRYAELVDARAAADPDFDKTSKFFPLYRSK